MTQISIIIPIYNAEQYIDKCINSLIEQEFKEIEIIAVDDGSTDTSILKLNEYASKDDRIKVISQENQGAGAARNNGMSIASGKYIHFLDVDDWITRDLYKVAYETAEKEQSEIVIFNYDTLDIQTNCMEGINVFRSKIIQGDLYTCDFYKMPRFFINSDVVPWNKLYRRSFVEDTGVKFDEIECANDRAFYYKTIMEAKIITLLPQMFMIYRIGNNSSLIGDTRLQKFECHFKSCKSTMEYSKNKSLRIQSLLFDAGLVDLFYFYNKSIELKQQQIILVQIREFLLEINKIEAEWVRKSRFKNKIQYILGLDLGICIEKDIKEITSRLNHDRNMNNTTSNQIISLYEFLTQNGMRSTFKYILLKVKSKQ